MTASNHACCLCISTTKIPCHSTCFQAKCLAMWMQRQKLGLYMAHVIHADTKVHNYSLSYGTSVGKKLCRVVDIEDIITKLGSMCSVLQRMTLISCREHVFHQKCAKLSIMFILELTCSCTADQLKNKHHAQINKHC